MAKTKDSVWGIFTQGAKLYFTNFGAFFRYMAFPVFGQILGIILILMASFFYASVLPKMIVPGGLFDNFLVIFFVLFLVTLPGLMVLIKAFWDYLVAYGAVNSMLESMMKTGKLYDFHAHTEVINRRSASFCLLWVLLALFGLLGSFPLLWVVFCILFVYFALIFQVFTYEPDKSAFECFSRSFELIKGRFWPTVGLMILLGALTYWILPEVIKAVFNFIGVISLLAIPLDAWTHQLPINAVNDYISHQTPLAYQISSLMVAKFMLGISLGYIVTSLTLPLRVICWGLWYKKTNEK